MAEYSELLAWAIEKGVGVNKISPKRIPGAGLGIVAAEDIEVNDIVLKVPAACLRTVDTFPTKLKSKLPKDMTVHSLLALDIVLDPTSAYSIWQAAFPPFSDFQKCIPLLWDSSTTSSHLPFTVRKLVDHQLEKLSRDWSIISPVFPDLSEDRYTHAWLLVNTRTFYYATSRHERLYPKDDRMALQPIADLFNHSSCGGCTVSFDSRVLDSEGFAVKATRAYKKGQEVTISYGNHSNDLLLAEYGFCLEENEWDEVCIDEAILPLLSKTQKEILKDRGFKGGYIIDGRTPVCYRTEVAVRVMLLGERKWEKFVGGEDDGNDSQREVDRTVLNALQKWRNEEYKMGNDIKGDAGKGLRLRWKQIWHIVTETCEILEERVKEA
ncbi:Ribosomal lysine N-methyltransferase set11 [Zalerion maritima]|uniref:Ribosomal lysine N-methyltransferase set11 n=1 Tax=Zalerion maritima TaxID=339359 RepID=A0AAD5RRX0_9PEZI|nr:Ribosomal lysine N-methyltransferase set11 [Zalerion maritima]